MTNIDNETQAESCILDNKKMKMIMEKFKHCTEIKSNFITSHIEEVKKLYEIFRNFLKDSLDFNIRLKKYSRNVLFFTECFNDNSCTHNEILALLKDLLEESKKNHGLAKELGKKLFDDERNGGFMGELDGFISKPFGDKRIMNELIKTKNSLQILIQDINNKIDLDEKVLVLHEKSTFNTISLGVRLRLAAFLDSGTGKDIHKNAVKEEGKKAFSNQLSNKKNELIVMNLFNEDLESIILIIDDIKTFWKDQVNIIECLMENLEKFIEGGESYIARRLIK
ncbi:hypothetical protein RclHR1_17360001 [Rhizophagus clarus]|uniref:Uncharacterized protein n=1 Tax=Rhizophagus clarus TaxID=94130 RepID=A0A2Z6QLB1_9GLOM|nr:hypothetical protein RclHR1_17360001 [Rhizophagus clarus]GES80959.1 hypothetical protein GLOIN_2v1797743 [Rhizophagus clarus]